MRNDSTNTDVSPPSSGSYFLPALVVALTLAFGVWWWLAREKGDDSSPNSAVEPISEQRASAEPRDPWEDIQQTIYPRGRIETVHQTAEFTYLYVRSEDGNRWVATPRAELHPGDIVQMEVAPRSVKRNFPAKALDRVFPKIVLVGRDRVKVTQPAAGGSDES